VILSRPTLRDLGEITRHIAQDNPATAPSVSFSFSPPRFNLPTRSL
jgi:hypothetical protein